MEGRTCLPFHYYLFIYMNVTSSLTCGSQQPLITMIQYYVEISFGLTNVNGIR